MKNIAFIIIFLFSANTIAVADSFNLDTGEYIMDMGGGDSMNLDTGEYIFNLD
jgi:hypothetical protein